MSTDQVWQHSKLEFLRWLKTASTASFSFVVRSIHEKAFKSAADIAIKEVASAITRATGGQDLNTLSNDDRMIVLTLQTLKDDMQRQLDEALLAWPPKEKHGPTTL